MLVFIVIFINALLLGRTCFVAACGGLPHVMAISWAVPIKLAMACKPIRVRHGFRFTSCWNQKDGCHMGKVPLRTVDDCQLPPKAVVAITLIVWSQSIVTEKDFIMLIRIGSLLALLQLHPTQSHQLHSTNGETLAICPESIVLGTCPSSSKMSRAVCNQTCPSNSKQ